MSIMRDKNLEALTRQFEEDRARVWTDPSIPHDQKQAQVYRLWQEFDSQRRALQEGYFQGGTRGRARIRDYGTTRAVPTSSPAAVEMTGRGIGS